MPKTVTPQQIEAAKRRLLALPEKPKPPKAISLSDAVRQMKAEVQAAIKRGYTFAEITGALQEDGIEVGTPTLKSYVYRGTRRRPGSTKAKPKTQPSETQSKTPIVETKPTVEKPKKGRAGSKAVEMPENL